MNSGRLEVNKDLLLIPVDKYKIDHIPASGTGIWKHSVSEVTSCMKESWIPVIPESSSKTPRLQQIQYSQNKNKQTKNKTTKKGKALGLWDIASVLSSMI